MKEIKINEYKGEDSYYIAETVNLCRIDGGYPFESIASKNKIEAYESLYGILENTKQKIIKAQKELSEIITKEHKE